MRQRYDKFGVVSARQNHGSVGAVLNKTSIKNFCLETKARMDQELRQRSLRWRHYPMLYSKHRAKTGQPRAFSGGAPSEFRKQSAQIPFPHFPSSSDSPPIDTASPIFQLADFAYIKVILHT